MTRFQQLAPPLFLSGLVLLWLLECNAERHWLLASITYVPQHGLLVPWFLLFYGAIRRCDWSALGIHFLSLSLIVFFFLGLNIPLRRLVSHPQNAGTKLRVVSYNLKLSEKSARDVGDAIQNLKADIICAQEVPWIPSESAAVTALLRDVRGWNVQHDGKLLTLSRLPISQARVHLTASRKIACQEITVNAQGKMIHVFNVHLPSPGGDAKHFTSRLAQIMPLRAAQAQTIRKATNIASPTIIMGDFNTPPRGQIYRSFNAHWTDAWRAASWGSGCTFPVGLPLVRIDYLWLSRDIEVAKCFISDETASDHFPLVADIVL